MAISKLGIKLFTFILVLSIFTSSATRTIAPRSGEMAPASLHGSKPHGALPRKPWMNHGSSRGVWRSQRLVDPSVEQPLDVQALSV